MPSLNDQLRAELQSRAESGLRRALKTVPPGIIDLSSNDYLGLARHPAVIAAACEAAQEHGTGARASRLVGSTLLHERLEHEIARFKGCAAALVMPSGYQVNLAVISALARRKDVIFCDKRNHASLVDACRLAHANGAVVRYYNSLEKLRALLEKSSSAPRLLIVTDAVFSMDGDLADLRQLAEAAQAFNAILILDDAHGTGVLGTHGHGTVEHYGLSDQSDQFIHLGTLSKAIGTQGGFVAGTREIIEWLVNTARPFIYTTGLNPAAVGAALAAFEILQREPERLSYLREVTRRLASGLRDLGFDARHQPAPIIPVMLGEAQRAVALSEALLAHGVWCPAIRPPTVPAGTSRLRVTASAALANADLERALAAFAAARE
ncbi:MAG TPA: 8-amino-7-oxononanoate synthase [Abditibacteriaceae bacterium]|nr:8-amino-7-oxononanoate synthase [Abditibacteriaceae bacterium]